jgi:hypothetical protein
MKASNAGRWYNVMLRERYIGLQEIYACSLAEDVPITSTTNPITTVIAPKGLAYFCIRGALNVMSVVEEFVEKPDIVNSWTRASKTTISDDHI